MIFVGWADRSVSLFKDLLTVFITYHVRKGRVRPKGKERNGWACGLISLESVAFFFDHIVSAIAYIKISTIQISGFYRIEFDLFIWIVMHAMYNPS